MRHCIADELHRGVWTIQQDQTACLAGIGDMTGFDQDSFAPRTSSDIFSHTTWELAVLAPQKSRLRRSAARSHTTALTRIMCRCCGGVIAIIGAPPFTFGWPSGLSYPINASVLLGWDLTS